MCARTRALFHRFPSLEFLWGAMGTPSSLTDQGEQQTTILRLRYCRSWRIARRRYSPRQTSTNAPKGITRRAQSPILYLQRAVPAGRVQAHRGMGTCVHLLLPLTECVIWLQA
ncbi:uncharacterized protein SCHCODRAFT_02195926 [Schizophyllum commune H4-8]|uniref:uncharacterized protein n=1 Tax=Schizophyllum commune (strain H4-8 / FGSC 9210) TaxID=578458 RepID=UPI00215E4B45|nr:uncharacterized protein SCHCODRAFT_02195926 [Schizophyllum commune H4-8]KAI5896645.1 hypothetical protein SCHCODRAFT_02195926 [Schizophyllum commune H4-8]